MFTRRHFSFLLLLSCTGCVSVNLGSGKVSKNTNINFQAPSQGFREISNPSADQAWQNSETGNTISFMTECPAPDSSLESMTDEFTSVLKSKQVKEKKEDFFNGRESLQTWAEGKLDGIPMKIRSLVFKKNGCSYLLTYVGRARVFEKNHEAFTEFISKFEAP